MKKLKWVAGLALAMGLGVMPVLDRLRILGQGEVDFNYFHRATAESSVDYSGAGRMELKLGPVLFEAKLTESDFQTQKAAIVEGYRDL